MPVYEYKVVPAPAKGLKIKGVKTPEERFANSVQAVLNDLGAEGWEYLRSELLPNEERSGLTGTTTNWRNVLVFRRAQSAGQGASPQPVDDTNSDISRTGLPTGVSADNVAPLMAMTAAAAQPPRPVAAPDIGTDASDSGLELTPSDGADTAKVVLTRDDVKEEKPVVVPAPSPIDPKNRRRPPPLPGATKPDDQAE